MGASLGVAFRPAYKHHSLCRYEPTHDELYQAFQDAVGGAAEGEAEEQIDEDIAIEGGPQLARNDRCPITGKAVSWVLQLGAGL